MKQNARTKWQKRLSDRAAILLLLGTVLLAIFFRFWRLDSLPPALSSLEAVAGLSALKIISAHSFSFFYAAASGSPQEALFVFLQVIPTKLLGSTAIALRVVPAALGVITVILTYLWAKNWFSRRVALVAAFLMAVNTWVVLVNRTGVRANLVPLIVAGFAYLIYKALQTKKVIFAILAGLVLALGLYAHLQILALWLAVGLFGIYALIWRRQYFRTYKNIILATVIAALVAVLPMVVYVAKNPAKTSYSGLGNKIVLFNSDKSVGSRVVTVVENKAKFALGLFSFGHGDQNPTRNVAGEPLLNVFVALMWALGLILCLSQFRRAKYVFLLLIFAAISLPAVMATAEVPNGLLLLGAAPAIMIFAGLGVDYMLRRWYQTFPLNNIARTVGLTLIMSLLALTAYQSYKAYFIAYAGELSVRKAFNEDISAVVAYAQANQPAKGLVITGTDQALIVKYLTPSNLKLTAVSYDDVVSLPIDGSKKVFFVSAEEDGSSSRLELLKTKYPDGRLSPQYSNFDNRKLFYVYEVEK